MLLSVSNLTVVRAGFPVLAGLSFELEAGQALFLRGRNGVGKTTLLRCIAGLQPAGAGQIKISVDSVAYSGHADGVKLQLTVVENLRFWADVFGTSHLESVLHALDLAGLAHRLAGNLSAGQRRRLGLARMLLSNCTLWLFDEPTVSLDKASERLFAAVLRQHLNVQGAVLIATHTDIDIPAEQLQLDAYCADFTVPKAFDEAFL